MSLELQFQIGGMLLLAALLSMVIGLDRELHSPAGLRTHMLVGLGACLFTQLSIHGFANGDPARIAAQVVTGIGFLGAGTILQRKGSVHHLTTAASIWSTAAVGMAVGVGAWFLAILATLIIWFILAIVRHVRTRQRPEDVPQAEENGVKGKTQMATNNRVRSGKAMRAASAGDD
jgi:putative Mg2+ transporter-C (MgtC) family protein